MSAADILDGIDSAPHHAAVLARWASRLALVTAAAACAALGALVAYAADQLRGARR